MHIMKVSPLDIPEILLLIGDLLKQRDLLACSHVSKAWKDAFAPRFWETVEWQSIGANDHVRFRALSNNTQYLRTLNIYQDIPPQLGLLNCPRLESLTCVNIHLNAGDSQMPPASPDVQSMFIESLVRQSPRLRIFGPQCPSFVITAGLCDALQGCTYLSEIDTEEIKVDNAALEDFWRVCFRMKSFTLTGEGPSRMPTVLSRHAFLNLTRLSLQWPAGISAQIQLELIAQCPRLENLAWILDAYGKMSVERTEYPKTDFVNLAARGTWPNLSTLSMHNSRLTDVELERLLSSMIKVSGFHLGETGFGPLSFPLLKHHLETVTSLFMSTSPGFTSAMVQKVLESFPNLEIIQARVLHGDDILNGRPWVCRALSHRQIYLDLDPSKDQKLVFERIGTLNRLDYFKFAERDDLKADEKRYEGPLRLTLDDGMRELGRLRELKWLGIGQTEQRMSIQDVAFMIMTWKGLIIEGNSNMTVLHPEERENSVLISMIRLAGCRLR